MMMIYDFYSIVDTQYLRLCLYTYFPVYSSIFSDIIRYNFINA